MKSLDIPNEGFPNGSCRAKELNAYWLPKILYASDDVFSVLKIFTNPSSNMFFN
jgi:hypothetical protein